MAEIRYQVGCDGLDWAQMKTRLIEDAFDNGRTLEQYRASFENTHTVVLAFDGDDLIGTVRALSDGICNAYVVDVWTYRPYRQQGVASEMMRLALVQLAGQHVYLFTDDAQAFYAKLGFVQQDSGMGRVIGQWLKNDST